MYDQLLCIQFRRVLDSNSRQLCFRCGGFACGIGVDLIESPIVENGILL